MLIVVSIMMLLVVAAATTFRPATESRRIREAARAINVYLSSARNRAMETGRPCGVMLRRFAVSTTPPVGCVMTLDQCEVPPCYCGDTEQSTARVQYDATANEIIATLCTSDSPDNLLRNLDLIQFNYQGPCYSIKNLNSPDYIIASSGTWELHCDATGQWVPWPTAPPFPSVPYRIFRTPVKGAAAPLQLPASAVVDLEASGIDGGASFSPATNPGDVMILFAPNGSVDRVYIIGDPSSPYVVTNPIFLLVGKRERVGTTFYAAPNETQMTNYQDLNNIWVVINPQTGLINSEPVGSSTASIPQSVADARDLAREGQGMGGK